MSVERRNFLGSILAGTSFLLPPAAQARGLVQFPCAELGNTYHFIRAGESLMEEENIWSTNPLFLTNRDSALSDEGISQVEATCQYLKEIDINPTIVMYSLAASSMDTANIIGRELRLGRDRLVPEFTYLDPRAIGMWDCGTLSSTEAAVWAMDNDEAGAYGRGARPPPNEDGTPNETLDNQSTRLRQLLSLMETQYSGDTVLLVFPDGTGPALLSAMIAGIPYNRVHELNLRPGEIRLDVNMKSTKELLNSGTLMPTEDYKAKLAEGRQELKRLRSIKSGDIISVKDQKLENDRLEMEAAAKQRETKRLAKDQSEQLAREARAREIQEERQRRRDADGSDIDNTGPVLGMGTVGMTAAAAAMFSGSRGGEKDQAFAEVNPANLSNETGTPLPETLSNVDVTNKAELDILDGLSRDLPLIDESDDGLIPSFVDISNMTGDHGIPSSVNDDTAEEALRQHINGDRLATFPPPQKSLDPVEAADEAMREYMELDDGGSEWLAMMSYLMQENDEGDMDEQHPGLRP
jgi:broad specificity phosphatase PhoE